MNDRTEEFTLGRIYWLGSPDAFRLEETASIIKHMAKKTSYEKITFPSDRKAIDIGGFDILA